MTDWLHPEKDPLIVCRPALPKDTAEVLELTRTIWEGEDYVPRVWGEWLADPEGLLAVAEYRGRVSGLGKLTRLGAEEWWLEGLRVHPQLEGHGIASHLHDYLTGHWERCFSGVLRLATASFRAAVQHLSERSGFRKVGEYTFYESTAAGPPGTSGSGDAFQPLQPGEEFAALDFIGQTPPLPGSTGLMDLGWQWARPSIPRLEDAVWRGQAWWWRGSSERRNLHAKSKRYGRRALLLADEDQEERGEGVNLRLQLLACPSGELGACLQDFRALAGALGYANTTWIAPLHTTLAAIFEEAGFQRAWDASLYLYEKAHPRHPSKELSS